MSKTYNVGFIGFGFIGKVHAYGYVNLPFFYDIPGAEFRLTHVCTSRAETAEAGRRLIGAETATTNWREITENPAVDIVHICSPNDLHRDQLLSAMAHQKHIYCDKPLTATLDESLAIEAALDDYHGISQMTFQSRFFPATMRARQLVEEGFLGEILEFHGAFHHSGSVSPTAPLKWKLSAAAGGGVIADLGSHVIDLLEWLTGDFAELMVSTHIAYPRRPSADDPERMVEVDAEDSVTMLARLPNGALGSINATKLATGTEDELRFEIFGAKGAIRFNLMHPHQLEIFDTRASGSPLGGNRGWTAVETGQRYPQPANGFPSPKCSIGWMRGHQHCLANFATAVATGQPAQPDLRHGVHIQRLLEACRQSASLRSWQAAPRRS